MCFDYVDGFESEGVENEDFVWGWSNVCGLRGCVRWLLSIGFFVRFGERVGDEVVFWGGRESVDGGWIWGSWYCIEKIYVVDVVEVDFFFENDCELFVVELDGEDGGGEGEFVDNGCVL